MKNWKLANAKYILYRDLTCISAIVSIAFPSKCDIPDLQLCGHFDIEEALSIG